MARKPQAYVLLSFFRVFRGLTNHSPKRFLQKATKETKAAAICSKNFRCLRFLLLENPFRRDVKTKSSRRLSVWKPNQKDKKTIQRRQQTKRRSYLKLNAAPSLPSFRCVKIHFSP